MKAKLTGFFTEFDDALAIAKTYKLNQVALKSYQSKSWLDMETKDIKALVQTFKEQQLKSEIIDLMMDWNDFYDVNQTRQALNVFKEIVKKTEPLKAKYFILQLPFIHDVLKEFKEIEIVLNDFVEVTMKNHKTLVIKPDPKQKPNTLAYILKKYDTPYVGVVFDPAQITLSGESATTTYRILRSYIKIFYAVDVTYQGIPKLIGYGNAQTAAILKKLKRDQYNQIIIVDNNFSDYLYGVEARKSLVKKLFSRSKKEKKQSMEELGNILKPNENIKNVTYRDILENQIQFIHKLLQ